MDQNIDLNLLVDANSRPPSVEVVSERIQEAEREKAILAMIYDYSFKKGIESEIKIINTLLSTTENQRNLDAIYNFNGLMIKDRIVPPVITEAKNLIQNNGSDTLKTASVLYKIDKQAEFSTLAPNWRSYLVFPTNEYSVDILEAPTRKNSLRGTKYKKLVEETTKKGFIDGQKQAQDMLKYALNKLNKDYIGMLRFHEFVAQGKVTMPSISRVNLAITSSSDTMILDQDLLKIRTLPSFNGNMLKWTTWITPSNYDVSKQIYTINGQ